MTKKTITNDDIMQALGEFAASVDARFQNLELGQMRIEKRLDSLEERVINLEKTLDDFMKTADHIIARLDRQEVEDAARDSQFEKLLAWARKVSKKTGIPLENL